MASKRNPAVPKEQNHLSFGHVCTTKEEKGKIGEKDKEKEELKI